MKRGNIYPFEKYAPRRGIEPRSPAIYWIVGSPLTGGYTDRYTNADFWWPVAKRLYVILIHMCGTVIGPTITTASGQYSSVSQERQFGFVV